MNQFTEKPKIEVIGLDLAKHSIQAHGQDERGRCRLDRKFTPKQLRAHLAQLPPCVIGIEACGRAHHWARTLGGYGHEVKLIAPQFVKPFVKSNKNDRADAEAICEAVQRPSMRFVGVKSVAQQDLQSLLRLRGLAVEQRTAKVNQVRGLLAEYGIEIAQGRAQVRQALPEILEDAENGLSGFLRSLLQEAYEELAHQDERIERLSRQIEQFAGADAQAKLLQTIPGIGPVVAATFLAAVGDIHAFRNGGEVAAWMGLTPRQHSTGGKERLRGISKRGNATLRWLFVVGAQSALRQIERKGDAPGLNDRERWVRNLLQRRPRNVVVVALAARMARTAYAVLTHGEAYRPDYQPAS